MDTEEVRRVLFRRVESLDSENTLKIMGYLLLKGWGEKDMLELAISSDYALQSLVAEAKLDLGLTLPHFKSLAGRKYAHPSLDSNYFQDFNAFSGQMTRAHFDDPMVARGYFQRPNPNTSFLSPGKQQYFHNLSHNQNLNQNPNLILNQNQNQNQNQNISLNLNLNQNQNLNINHGLLTISNNWSQHGAVTSPRIISNGFNSNYPSIPTSSSSEKPCPHFAWGFCKHGSNCRFSHAISSPPPPLDDNNNNSFFLSPSSLECLKIELKELLQGRKNPVSIASLPQLYFEKYGKTLQAEGYLTESQRHGKSGFSLTKLLSKLNNTVMIIDRPHGQHAVMLIEEEPKLKESGETVKDTFNGMNSNSRQIYLTFPAESTFTEEDVIIHFRAYGPVQDVRIPYQQKRMFGFVTFMYSETVQNILVEGNPHYICGARVLVKPYKEKGKINDTKKSREQEGNTSTQSNGFCNNFDHLARHYFPFSSAFQYNKHNQGVKTNSDATNASVDEQFLSLGRKIEEMKLDQNNNNQNNNITSEASSSFFYHESDEELNPMMPLDNAEDCFHLQSNIFRYVLDIIDGDGKEGDFVEQSDKHSNKPISSDLKILGDPFNYNLREVSDPALKRTDQKSFETGCNWSEPTLFASSVY